LSTTLPNSSTARPSTNVQDAIIWLQSRNPELIWMVLDKRIATKNELTDAWTASRLAALRGKETENGLESAKDVMELLKKFSMSKEMLLISELPKTADADHTEPAAPEQPRSVKNNMQKQFPCSLSWSHPYHTNCHTFPILIWFTHFLPVCLSQCRQLHAYISHLVLIQFVLTQHFISCAYYYSHPGKNTISVW